VYDREAPASLRALIVAKGEVVTSQDVSPSAAAPQSKELLDSAGIKVDSDQAADLALSYAAANNVKVSAMNFELARQGAKAVPVWIVSCLDKNGGPLGSVVITASRGSVVASEGFPNAPDALQKVAGMPETRPAPVIRTAALDPEIMSSDREFLKQQARESATPPQENAAPAPSAQVESPAPSSRAESPERSPRVASAPPSTRAESSERSTRLADAAPPAPVASAPPVAASKESKESRVVPKAKPTPTPAKIASRKHEAPADRTEAVTSVPDESIPESAPDEAFDRSRHRTDSDRFSSEDEQPRRKIHVGRFIHRILPF
jgi:hypothetical protein